MLGGQDGHFTLFSTTFVIHYYFYSYEYHIDLCNESCSSGWPAGHLVWQKFDVAHCRQAVQPIFFILVMLIGTMDFYHFVPLYVILTLPGSHNVSTKQNLLASFYHTLFIWSGWNLMWWWSNSGCIWDYWNKGNKCCFTDYIKTLTLAYIQMFMNGFWFKLGVMIDAIVFYTLVTSLTDLDLDSRSQECRKTKTSPSIISQSFQSVWMDFGVETCWCDEPHTHFILAIQYSRERTLLIWFC